MASVSRDAEGAKDRVEYMRSRMHFLLASMVNDEQADRVIFFISALLAPTPVAEVSRGRAGITKTSCEHSTMMR